MLPATASRRAGTVGRMTDAALIGAVAAPDLHVMTYNIRRRMRTLRPDSPDRWDTRKPLMRRLLAAEQPTLLGVQEALLDQADFVADALGPHYRWVGHGRHAAGHDEHNPIYYDSRRLELTDWRQWALSATPDAPGSRSFGNLVRRVVVSARPSPIVATGSQDPGLQHPLRPPVLAVQAEVGDVSPGPDAQWPRPRSRRPGWW